MNSKEFKKALDELVKEKGIDPEIVYEAMEKALSSAYKKNIKREKSDANFRVLFDQVTGEIKVYSYQTVVEDDKMTKEEYEDYLLSTYDEDQDEELKEAFEAIKDMTFFDPKTEIKLSDAKKIDKTYEVGDTIDTEVTPKDFGHEAISIAKQVVVQQIREAERKSIIKEFEDKKDELLIGEVELEDENNYYINLGKTNGILPKGSIIPGEEIKMGSQIKVYVKEVKVPETNNQPVEEGKEKDKRKKDRNVTIILSRTHFNFVKRLFELEIPEINDGTVLIHSVAREAGARSKVAVESINPSVDPIGACIGEKGSRIARIIEELSGEKLDIVKYDSDPAVFIENALSPAKELTVAITDAKERKALVIAHDEDNYSLAIGKRGQNARLAHKLTDFNIDIKTVAEASEMGINIR